MWKQSHPKSSSEDYLVYNDVGTNNSFTRNQLLKFWEVSAIKIDGISKDITEYVYEKGKHLSNYLPITRNAFWRKKFTIQFTDFPATGQQILFILPLDNRNLLHLGMKQLAVIFC